MISYLRTWLQGDRTPRILITLSTSDPTLSWSGGAGPAFSVTLEAKVEAECPITIYPFKTLLETEGNALYQGGFTFTNTLTGDIAERGDMSDCRISSTSYITMKSAIEIPKQQGHHRPGFLVTHRSMPPTSSSRWHGHSSGLEVGQEYEIGLGDELSKVRWWEWGSLGEVFSFPFYRRSDEPRDGTPELQMVLMNRIRFTVVE